MNINNFFGTTSQRVWEDLYKNPRDYYSTILIQEEAPKHQQQEITYIEEERDVAVPPKADNLKQLSSLTIQEVMNLFSSNSLNISAETIAIVNKNRIDGERLSFIEDLEDLQKTLNNTLVKSQAQVLVNRLNQYRNTGVPRELIVSLPPSLTTNNDDSSFSVPQQQIFSVPVPPELRISPPLTTVDPIYDSDRYRDLKGHLCSVLAIAVMPDGETIVSGGIAKTIKIWNSKIGNCSITIRCPHYVGSLFCYDQKTIFAGLYDGEIVKIDVNIDVNIPSIVDTTWCAGGYHASSVATMKIMYGDTQSILCSGSNDRTIKLWDISNGNCLATLTGHTNHVNCLALFPKSFRLVSGSKDRKLIIWDLAEKKKVMTLNGHTESVKDVVSLSNNRIVSCGGYDDNSIRLWDVMTGAPLFVRCGDNCHLNGIYSLVVLSDNMIASGGDDARGTIIIWDIDDYNRPQLKQTLDIKQGGVQNCLSVLSDNRLVSGSENKTLRIWY